MTEPLTKDEADLLKWLGQEEYSQYGECHGASLNSLVAKGLAQVHGAGEHQHFIASDFTGDKGMMFRAVSLTDAGREAQRARLDTR